MLKKLTLVNFQKHRKLVLDLTSPVTCLTGPSDRGKSAVLRALRWVILNLPRGKGMVTRGKKLCKVSLEFDDHVLVRKLRKGGNLYILDGQELKAFGTGVPQEVENLLSISQVSFQRQHDSSFWLSLPAGQVSRELNQVVNLEVIDSSLTFAGAELRKAKERVSLVRERLDGARDRKKALSHVPTLLEDLADLEQKQETILKAASRLNRLGELVGPALCLTQTLKTGGKALLGAAKGIVRLEEASNRLQGAKERLARLETLLSQASRIQECLSDGFKELEALQAKLKAHKLCPACGKPL